MQHYSKNQSEVISSSNSQRIQSVFFTKAMECRKKSFALKKGKRYRSAFTTEQVNYLEMEFRKFPYIGNAHRKEVASALNIPERAVKIWFQNRRMKEKKETVAKEPEIDDQNDCRNVAFANEPLNNVPDIPSTNDKCSKPLPLLTSLESTANGSEQNTTYHHPDATKEIQKAMFYKELSPNHDQSAALNINYRDLPPVTTNSFPASYKSSAEFSIDLCKKYRSDLIYRSQLPKKIKFEDPPLQLIKQNKSEDSKSFIQNVPEDLSYNKDRFKPELDSVPKTISPSNVGFQPVYVANYAQPYLPAGNMLWKPLNVMPIMSTGASAVTISSNLPGNLPASQEQSVPKKTCCCDCHSNVPNVANLSEPVQPPQAQYIITAVPFQNYTKF